jgi:hypothetical protein
MEPLTIHATALIGIDAVFGVQQQYRRGKGHSSTAAKIA